MKNHISFTTELFDSTRRDAGDGRIGEDLARWFISKSQGGEFIFAEPSRDEHGWTDTVTAEGEKFKLDFDIIDETIGSGYADWRITIEKLNRWKVFGSKDSELRGRLCDLIHNVLRDEGQIREVKWG